MAMRITGMNSGLDTESIIQEMVAARRTKVDAKKKEQTKLNWKQDAWKELNTKLKNLQNKYLSNMRFSDSYSKKTTKVSNSNAVSVITGKDAVNGVQSLEIEKLAKTGYLTGAVVKPSEEGREITALSKLSDLEGFDGISGDGTISIKTGSKSVDIKVTGDTTISDVLTQIKNAGLNASFDAKWQRFNISSKESGEKNDFSIVAADENGAKALSALGIQTDITKDAATMAEYEKYAAYFVGGDRTATLANMQGMIDKRVSDRTDSYLNQYKSLKSSAEAAQKKIDEINDKYGALDSADTYKTALEAKNEEIKNKKADLENITDPDAKKAAEEELVELEKEAAALKEKQSAAETLKKQQDSLTQLNSDIDKIAGADGYITVTESTDAEGKTTYSAAATAKLTGEVEDYYYKKAEFAKKAVDNPSILASNGASKVSGQDALIRLNGAEYENDNNTFEINGLTFTALSETKAGESITVTTEQDTDGIYDMVKNFLKEYNSIVNEMDKLYNADPAKGYEPLTDEEKESMSESEIEKWETKIKDSILRRDSGLSSVNSALKEIMAGGIEVNGKTMYLFDFGIETLGYFNAADNERNAYHINGDPDDESTSGKADKLKGMIANDPDTVISFFTKLSQNLYSKMSDLSKSVDGYRSFGNFYDDKKMKSDYDDYASKIKDMEDKLADYEDKWYKKFSAMETALAKMQSNANAVTSLLGG